MYLNIISSHCITLYSSGWWEDYEHPFWLIKLKTIYGDKNKWFLEKVASNTGNELEKLTNRYLLNS